MASGERADKWLWAVRLFKTRSVAAEACAGGRVTRQGQRIKPASALREGDVLELPFPDGPGRRMVEVLDVIQQRVGAPQAQQCYADRTPPETLAAQQEWKDMKREAPKGRPTKKDRRSIERFRGFFE